MPLSDQAKIALGAGAAVAGAAVLYYVFSSSPSSEAVSQSGSEAKPAKGPSDEHQVTADDKKPKRPAPPAPTPSASSTGCAAADALGWPSTGRVPVIQYECVHRSAGEMAPITTRRPDEGFLSFEMNWQPEGAGGAKLLVEWTRFKMESDPDSSEDPNITQRILVGADGSFEAVANIDDLVDIATATALGGMGNDAMMEAQFAQIRPVIAEQIESELRATWDSISGQTFKTNVDKVTESVVSDGVRKAWSAVVGAGSQLQSRVWTATTDPALLKEMVRQSLAQVFGGTPPPKEMLDFKLAEDRVEVSALTAGPGAGRAWRVQFMKRHALSFTCNGENVSRKEFIMRTFLILWDHAKEDAGVKDLIKNQFDEFIAKGNGLLAEADEH